MTTPHPQRRGERGIALVITLLVVALLTILVVEFTYSVQVESHMSRNSLSALQATYLARSGINIMAGALMQDNSPRADPDDEDPDEGWISFIVHDAASGDPAGAPQTCSTLPALTDQLPRGWHICVRIIDEGAKLNFNMTRPTRAPGNNATVPPSGQPDQCQNEDCWVEALRRLFERGGVDESVADDIVDYWINDVPTPALGRPAQLFAPDFASFEDVAARFAALRTAYRELRSSITALPRTRNPRLNVNMAPPEVLSAILNDDEVVQRIIQERGSKHFTNSGEALEGVNNPHIRRMFDVRSAYFRLEASAVVNGIGKTVRALVWRNSAPRNASSTQQTSWSLTFLDWEKESGAPLFRGMPSDLFDSDFDPGANSANTGS